MARAAATTARARGSASKPKPKPSFLSPLSPPRGGGVGSGGSLSPSSPVDFGFLASSSSAKPRPSFPLVSPRASSASASPLVAAASAASTVGDLRSLAASHLDSLKRRFDTLHSHAVRDIDAAHSRISKRFKIQNQASQQLTDEVDREYKKVSDNIKKSTDMVKASYKQIIAEAQSSTSRVCKVTIPEMVKSVEKTIDNLRSRYTIPMTPA